ncbi:pyridoxamine 5'-phosphate oxidase [Saccharomonospora sp. CUA-673]|uniref:pyridoxamine 5'-phosphate oxidase family protein n=1 Tax=Saccharomonospora sp. CUA-673 TaxID=1904969 RepID=UPI00096389B5|nr:pyridoxamine 5'-phosphate oxidase family protein [Saccharomonospora sp. CUA-673]OLT46633.1 pyridoxamine 5'-phosphate oxidase [Saccharomonospora sp. CUA-673]
MALSVEERAQFLAEPNIGVLSVVEHADRGPLSVPIWYQYTPGGSLWLRTGADSRKARAIREAGRFSLVVERTRPTVRYVTVEGPAEFGEDSHDLSVEMAARYLAPDKVEAFLDYERRYLGDHVVISMRPERWLSLDMGAL